MKRIWIPRSKPDIGLQIYWMKAYFPQFKYERSRWRGTLRPQLDSSTYKVDIRYHGAKSPAVFVNNPQIALNAPHRYSDKSLCLYYPPDWLWSEDKIIAKTIVPWTAFWLFCYEYWTKEGEWYGEEAPHQNGKRRLKEKNGRTDKNPGFACQRRSPS